jgi:hypothetical protein
MSDTPRTDSCYQQILDEGLGLEYAEDELREWSKKLERELADAVAKERERCAKVCEERGSFNSMYAHHILTGAADAIRKGE